MQPSRQGIQPGRYMLVPRTLIFVVRDQHVLLLKGAPEKRLWANQYNGVGGHVERGEDLLSAAKRELFEETGLSGLDLWLCGTILIDTGENTGIGIYVLRGEAAQDLEAPRPSSEGSLEWVPFNQIERLPLVEDLYTILPRVLAMRPGDLPFSALIQTGPEGEPQVAFGA